MAVFKPHRPLKPATTARLTESNSRMAALHINVAKLYNVPSRRATQAWLQQQQQMGNHQASMFTPSEVIVELAFKNFENDNLFADTQMRVGGSINPDINYHLVFPLATGKDQNLQLTPEKLGSFTNVLYFNVFDETEVPIGAPPGGHGGRMQMVQATKRERRYLGTFALPWSTILANNSKVEGRFKVSVPQEVIGRKYV